MAGSESQIIPRWLKLVDAAKYSAIGRQRLIALAEEGTIRGFQDPEDGRRTYIFDRLSIDAYREAQAREHGITQERALEILRSVYR